MRKLLALAAGLSIACSALAAGDPDWDAPNARWHQGPVKYLLNKEETKAYKKLENGEEREAFVSEFWKRRDPTPDTPDNEYRIAFYRRAREAAAQYSEEGGKGWQDDRGKVYILLGPPDEAVEQSSLLDDQRPASGLENTSGGSITREGITEETASGPGTTTKNLRFVYLTNPLTGQKERLELTFTSEVTGGYRLRDRLDWDLPVLRGLVYREPPPSPATPGPSPAPAESIPSAVAPTPVASPVVEPPIEPTPEAGLIARVKESEAVEYTVPLDVTPNYYKAADDSTFATLTLEVKKSSLPPEADAGSLTIGAEIIDADTGESAQRFFKKGHFGPYEGNASGAEDALLFQAERPLNPGKYRAVFALEDPASGAIGKLEKELVVPSYASEGLVLSTVSLARRIEPLAAPPPEGTVTPFVIGTFTVVPRPDSVFQEGEEIAFYYQIYGAGTDAATKSPNLDLSYRFEKKVADNWRMVGGRPVLNTGQTGLVQAFSLPLTRWPTGEYRISIEVKDMVTGTTAGAEVPFSIIARAKAGG